MREPVSGTCKVLQRKSRSSPKILDLTADRQIEVRSLSRSTSIANVLAYLSVQVLDGFSDPCLPGDYRMIRLLVADAQSIIRDGMKAWLNSEPDLEVVGTADNGKTAIEQVGAQKPDVVLMDIQMPLMDGTAATRIICQRFPDIKVLILSMFDDEQHIREAIQAGAKGYLLKDIPLKELAESIRLVYRGYSLLAPRLLKKIIAIPVSDAVNPPPVQQELTQLTNREQQVLHLIRAGATNREIAQQLHISEGTVKTHVTHLFNRLNLRNRSQLAIYANSVFGRAS